MSTPRTLPQSKEALLKSYRTRLKDDVKSMVENFEGCIGYVYVKHLILISKQKKNRNNIVLNQLQRRSS